MKKKQIFISILSIFLFLSCKTTDNCISRIAFKKQLESPGPDLITFSLTSNEREFEKYIEEYGLIEVVFNEKKFFKTKVFEIIKIEGNNYELKAMSPYFSLIDYYTEEQVYTLFNESSNMQINITLNDKKFVFTKC